MGEQKKKKFNALDVLLLLAAAAVICFLAFRLWGPDKSDSGKGSEDYYVLTFIGDAVPNYVLDHLRMGAAVTNNDLTDDMGTVVDIQLGPSLYYSRDESGNWVNTSRDDSQSLKLMCAVKGSDHGDTFAVGGTALKMSEFSVIRAEEAKMYLMLYRVEKLSDTSYSIPETGQ